MKTPSLLHRSIIYPTADGTPMEVPLMECAIYCTIDTSGGSDIINATPETDKVGWCVNAVDIRGRWLILELRAEHLSDEQFVDKLYELEDRYAPRFAIEMMPHLATVLRLVFTRRDRWISYQQLMPGKRTKADRITRLRPLLPYIHFLDDIRQNAQHRLRNWYVGKQHGDDDLDAFGYMLDVARPPSVESIAERRAQQQKRLMDTTLARLSPEERQEAQHWIDYDLRQGRRHFNDELRDFLGFNHDVR